MDLVAPLAQRLRGEVQLRFPDEHVVRLVGRDGRMRPCSRQRDDASVAGTDRQPSSDDSSPAVRVTQKNGAPVAHAGISESGSSRQTARRCSSTERRSEVLSAGSPTNLLDVARRPGPRAADVGDEPCYLLGCGVVRGYGEHGVLARDGPDYLEPLHPVEDTGDGAGGPVAGVDDDLVLGRQQGRGRSSGAPRCRRSRGRAGSAR